MIEYIKSGGAYTFSMLALAIVIIALSIYKILHLFIKKDPNRARLEFGIDAILFWGGISAVFGFFSAFYGLYQGASSVVAVQGESISLSIVWRSIEAFAFYISFGLFTFIVAAIIWFILRVRYKNLTTRIKPS